MSLDAAQQDDALFDDLVRRKAEGRSLEEPLRALRLRWGAPARYVIRQVLKSYGQPEEDSEDLFQEALAKLVERGLDQFRGGAGHGGSGRAFFLRIAKHLAIDAGRRRREVLAETAESQELEPQTQDAVQAARGMEQRRDDSELYWIAMRRLEQAHPKEAEAWALYHHEGVEDHQACATRLGISLANSYKRVSRAQAYLKLYLLELAEDAAP
jgi:RNA polymerase sigma-70 factor, ECF subfamily